MPGDDRSTPDEVRLSNRARRPARVKSSRANMAFVPPPERVAAPVRELSDRAKYLAGMTTLTRADLGSGRGLTYEWEFFLDQIFQELGAAGIGPQTFQFVQSSALSVWNINHGLTGYPTVLVVDGSGQQLLTEVHYPDDQTVVIVHGLPYSGTAYLRI